MDAKRLIEALPLIFPGANMPKLTASADAKLTQADKFCHLLTNTDKERLWSEDIVDATGIPSKHHLTIVNRHPQIQAIMDEGGWDWASATELGATDRHHRARALVRNKCILATSSMAAE